jgi:hypothetical protein
MRRIAALLAVTALGAAACGGSDESSDAVDEGDGLDTPAGSAVDPDDAAGSGAGSGPVVEVFGTTPADAVDGFVFWDGGCGVVSTVDAPAFEEADVWVPASWEVVGTGDGVRVAAGGTEAPFSVGTSQQQVGTSSADILAGNFGGAPFEEIATLSWGASAVPLGYDGQVYRFVAPAATIRGGGLEFDIAFEAVLGATDDASGFDQDEVIAVFESLSLESCAIEAETEPILNRTVQIVD